MTEDTQTTESQETENPAVEPTDIFYPRSETKAEPTEEKSEPIAEVTPEDPDPEAQADETAESDETKTTKEPEFSNEELFVELDGKEYSLKEIDDWRLSGLRQSDYTKKTQEHANNIRTWEADKQAEIDAAVSDKYADIVGTLDALILEADVDTYGEKIDWAELRKSDIEEYDRLKAIKDKRIAAKDTATTENVQKSNEAIQAKATSETQKLATDNEWIKDGKQTEAYDKDMAMVKDQLDKAGVSEQERGGMLIAGQGQWIIDACRWRQSQEQVEKVKAKVRKLPIVNRPKANAISKSKSATDIMYPTSIQG